MSRWYAPLDPDCPVVKKFSSTLYNDPITQYYGVGGDVMEGWEPKHRASCKRCQEYGCANIEAQY